jgi:mono/diheme cytochrome c family protein
MLNKNYFKTFIGFSLITFLSACDNHNNTGLEFAPNMYYSAGYEPMSQLEGETNNINPLGMNMRLPVKGTVSRRNYTTKFGTGDSSKTDLMVYNLPADSIAFAEKNLKNPIPETEASLAEGQVLYERFCLHCHGETGKGDGLVGKMYKGVPVYSSDALKTMNDGHIYHVITFGKNRMWAHGSQISPADRWKIVQYVHQLQAQ